MRKIVGKINIRFMAVFFISVDILCTVGILFYPMRNAELLFQFTLQQEAKAGEEVIICWDNEEATEYNSARARVDGKETEITLPSNVLMGKSPYFITTPQIYKLRIYRGSILVKTFEEPEFAAYVNEKRELQHVMNEGFGIMLYELSSTKIIERAILSLGLLTGMIILFGLFCILRNKILFGKQNKNNFKKFIYDFKEYIYYAWYSAKTDLKAEVANSYLNWVWWILEPLCNMLVYYFIFEKIYGNTTPYFIIFIYSGLLMWNFFNRCIMYSIKLVRSNKDIITRVYIPKFVILISNMILNGIKLLISLGILAVMMILCKVPINFTIIYFFVAYIGIILFTFGCGAILLHFGVFIDDLAYAVGILLNMLFFLSGVFYEVETAVMAPFGLILKVLNPIAMFISSMRGALLYETAPNLSLLGVWMVLSITLCCIGVNVIYKYENSYVKVV